MTTNGITIWSFPTRLVYGIGATAAIGVFSQLAIPASEDTVILTIAVTSGTSAIDAVAVAIDETTHDGTTTKAVNGSF